MSSPSPRASSPAGRRRQSERSGETRARVIDAAVACVAEEGFRSTNLARIATRAGVSTGAIQHHFGDKASVLAAVVERSFEDLAADVARLPAEGRRLSDRLERFVDVLWAHYLAPESRASMEILIQMRGEEEFRRRSLPYLARIRHTIDRMWMGLFWDSEVSRERHVAGQRLLFTTLNGLAVEKVLFPDAAPASADLEMLRSRILQLLEEDRSRDAGPAEHEVCAKQDS
jgi:AcrR family transcriptional regulator